MHNPAVNRTRAKSRAGVTSTLAVLSTMDTLFGGDVHASLSGLELDDDCFDLGDGITLRKTYAHLMAHFVMAFKTRAA